MSLLSQFFAGGGSELVQVEFVMVGGGGGGGASNSSSFPFGGGGGAGELVSGTATLIKGVSYPISIGAGGAGQPYSPYSLTASLGSNSYFAGFVSGGGNGPFGSAQGHLSNAAARGPVVGGTVPSLSSSGSVTGFRLKTPHGYSPEFGPYDPSPVVRGSGGGGGSSSRGNSPNSDQSGGPGGRGSDIEFIGYPGTYLAGGGGGGSAPNYGAGGGGQGGGAPGGGSSVPTGGTGQAGTGGGGGGARYYGTSGAGGSGTLIIRYPTAFDAATVSGNTPTPAQPGYYVYKWNGSGSITF